MDDLMVDKILLLLDPSPLSEKCRICNSSLLNFENRGDDLELCKHCYQSFKPFIVDKIHLKEY